MYRLALVTKYFQNDNRNLNTAKMVQMIFHVVLYKTYNVLRI